MTTQERGSYCFSFLHSLDLLPLESASQNLFAVEAHLSQPCNCTLTIMKYLSILCNLGNFSLIEWMQPRCFCKRASSALLFVPYQTHQARNNLIRLMFFSSMRIHKSICSMEILSGQRWKYRMACQGFDWQVIDQQSCCVVEWSSCVFFLDPMIKFGNFPK